MLREEGGVTVLIVGVVNELGELREALIGREVPRLPHWMVVRRRQPRVAHGRALDD